MADLKILIPTDFSENSNAPSQLVESLSNSHKVHAQLMHVFQTPTFPPTPMMGVDSYAQFYDEQKKAFEHNLQETAKSKPYAKCQVVYELLTETVGSPGVEIINQASKNGFDLILTSSRHRSQIDEYIVGTELLRMVRRSKVPVMCLTEGEPLPTFKKALFTTDLSEESVKGLAHVGPLLLKLGVSIVPLHVTTPVNFTTSREIELAKADFMTRLNRLAPNIAPYLGGIACVQDRDLVNGILHGAHDLGTDLLVMGTHGRTGIALLLEGSSTEQVLSAARMPLLTYRLPA